MSWVSITLWGIGGLAVLLLAIKFITSTPGQGSFMDSLHSIKDNFSAACQKFLDNSGC